MATTETHEDLAAGALRYLGDPAFRADPHDFLDRLRAADPVHLPTVVVDDPLAREIFTSRMLFNDKPQHTRMRRLVSAAFTPAGVRRWQEEFTRIAEELLDEVEPKGAMDAVAEFGYPFAERIICFML